MVLQHTVHFIVIFFLFNFVISVPDEKITFDTRENYLSIDSDKNYYLIEATFNPAMINMKYLYLQTFDSSADLYVAQSSIEKPNYVNSLYSQIEKYPILFIPLSDFKTGASGTMKLNIGIQCREKCTLDLRYFYSNIIFMEDNGLGNIQIVLPSSANAKSPLEIDFRTEQEDSGSTSLVILSKTSSKRFDIKVLENTKDITDTVSRKYFPNGHGVNIASKNKVKVELINTSGNDEIIVIQVLTEEYLISLSEIENKMGMDFNLFSSQKESCVKTEEGKENIMLIDSYSKNVIFATETEEVEHSCYKKFIGENEICFNKKDNRDFYGVNFQLFYLDSDKLSIQSSLVPLISGNPKYIYLPGGYTFYHWLPKFQLKNEHSKIYYYVRTMKEKPIVSFTTCATSPYDCTFTVQQAKALPQINWIDNLGFFNIETTKNELQLMLVTCDKDCEYEVVMAYDNEPYFIYPNTNFTRFINDQQKDIYILPIPGYLEKDLSNIYIELTTLNGQADLYLYEDSNLATEIKTDIEFLESGKMQKITIQAEILKTKKYLDKELYITVKGVKDSLYNIKYGSIDVSEKKILVNNQLNTELLKVGLKNSYIFMNPNNKDTSKIPFNIIVDSQNCESTVNFNGKTTKGYKHVLTVETTDSNYDSDEGYHFDISLNNDGNYCTEGRESPVNIIGFSSGSNIMLSDNILTNITHINGNTYNYYFKPKEDNSDNSIIVELSKFSNKKFFIKFALSYYNPNDSSVDKKSVSLFDQVKETFDYNSFKISSDSISKICTKKSEADFCVLEISTNSSDTSIDFSIYIRRKDIVTPRLLLHNELLISDIETENYNYHYFYLDKKYDNIIKINSYGQKLKVYPKLITSKQLTTSADFNRVVILPTKANVGTNLPSFDNYKNQLIIPQSLLKTCEEPCQLYLGVYSPSGYLNNIKSKTTYSINAEIIDSTKDISISTINLPLNRFIEGSFVKTNVERKYFVKINNVKDNIRFELDIIKQNEQDDTEITAYIKVNDKMASETNYDQSFTSNDKIYILSKDSIKTTTNAYLYITLKATSTKANIDVLYKFRVITGTISSLTPIDAMDKQFCPVVKAKEISYYLIKKTADVPVKNINIFSDNENAKIYGTFVEPSWFEYSSDESKINEVLSQMQVTLVNAPDSNFLSLTSEKDEFNAILAVTSSKKGTLNLIGSPYETAAEDYLQYDQPKIYSINEKSSPKQILLHINNLDGSRKMINIKAFKGEGIITISGKTYILGINSNGKNELNLIVNESENEINLVVECYEVDNDSKEFTFSVNYQSTSLKTNNLEINLGKVNSFIYPEANSIEVLNYYMKVNFTKSSSTNSKNDIGINVKTICSSCSYEIKGFIVDESFIKSLKLKTTDNIVLTSEIAVKSKNIIKIMDGSDNTDNANNNITMYKVEIDAETVKSHTSKEQIYILLRITKSELKGNQLKIDITTFDLTGNTPFIPHQFYILKVSREFEYTKLLLVKNSIDYSQMKIEFTHPGYDQFDIVIAALDKDNQFVDDDLDENCTSIQIKDTFEQGKHSLLLTFKEESLKMKYVAFVLIPKNKNLRNLRSLVEEYDDRTRHFAFSYESKPLIRNVFYLDKDKITVSESDKHEFVVGFNTIKSDYVNKINAKYISKIYKFDDYKKYVNNIGDLDIYLGADEITPSYKKEEFLASTKSESKLTFGKVGEEKYIITLTAIAFYEEKEEVLGYKYATLVNDEPKEPKEPEQQQQPEPEKEETEEGSSHIVLIIIIAILALILIVICCLICCSRRKQKRIQLNVEKEFEKEKDSGK